MQVQWSPVSAEIFASAAQDFRICVWDISRIREKQAKEEMNAPPELLFLHAGHTANISDICWCGMRVCLQ
jgi:histone-binding protein RBBP4